MRHEFERKGLITGLEVERHLVRDGPDPLLLAFRRLCAPPNDTGDPQKPEHPAGKEQAANPV